MSHSSPPIPCFLMLWALNPSVLIMELSYQYITRHCMKFVCTLCGEWSHEKPLGYCWEMRAASPWGGIHCWLSVLLALADPEGGPGGPGPPSPQDFFKIMQFSGNCSGKTPILSRFCPPPQNSAGPPDQNPGSAPGCWPESGNKPGFLRLTPGGARGGSRQAQVPRHLASWAPDAVHSQFLQWRIQDFGQGVPAEFWPQGGPEPKICSK